MQRREEITRITARDSAVLRDLSGWPRWVIIELDWYYVFLGGQFCFES